MKKCMKCWENEVSFKGKYLIMIKKIGKKRKGESGGGQLFVLNWLEY